jgi:hypothetical protein
MLSLLKMMAWVILFLLALMILTSVVGLTMNYVFYKG